MKPKNEQKDAQLSALLSAYECERPPARVTDAAKAELQTARVRAPEAVPALQTAGPAAGSARSAGGAGRNTALLLGTAAALIALCVGLLLWLRTPAGTQLTADTLTSSQVYASRRAFDGQDTFPWLAEDEVREFMVYTLTEDTANYAAGTEVVWYAAYGDGEDETQVYAEARGIDLDSLGFADDFMESEAVEIGSVKFYVREEGAGASVYFARGECKYSLTTGARGEALRGRLENISDSFRRRDAVFSLFGE